MSQEVSVVGTDLARVDGLKRVTGRAQYGADVAFPGMLRAAVVRSPCPHALIRGIDTRAARALPGVRAVVTGADVPATRFGTDLKDTTILAVDRVRYVGEPVAAVAATTREIAEEAVRLIRVEYEELPAVFDPEEGMRDGAPLIHPDLATYRRSPATIVVPGTNVMNHFRLRRGDVEAGFAAADFVVEDRFTSQRAQHCPIEPHASVAQVDPSGKITLWTSTQSPFRQRAEMAEAFGLPLTMIRVIATDCGGGFGAKTTTKTEAIAAALSARAGGRPVSLVFSRTEEFIATVSRHPAVVYIKTGVARDGRLLARQVRIVWDTGAYSEKGELVSRNAGYAAAGPYDIPHVAVDSYCVYTNHVPAGAYRGFGGPQVTWAFEQHMDRIAERLGMDPLTLRLTNAVTEGSASATGEVLHSVGLRECLVRAAEAVDWSRPRSRPRGVGIACMHKNTAASTSSGAIVLVHEDGTVSLITGATEIGQGSHTVLTQICAEVLGVPPRAITVVPPDTDVAPFDFGAVSSRLTFCAGNAVRRAAEEARERLLEMAAERLEAHPGDLGLREGRVFVVGSPERGLTLADLLQPGRHYGVRRGYIIGRGSFTSLDDVPLDPETGQSPKPTSFWCYVAHAAEVEVDPETGVVTVLKIAAAHDVGKAINPGSCVGQIHGSLAFGVSTALLEELVTENGTVVNPSFVDYMIPTAVDMPEVLPILVEATHRDGPYGAKGLADAGVCPTAAAIANAVAAATGVRIHDAPITPERVLAALRARERERSP